VKTVTAPHPVRCYIAIGSNLGERLALCHAAIDQLAALPQSRLGRRSSWYETEPVLFDVGGHGGKVDHFNSYPLIPTPIRPPYPEPAPGWFINGVVELTTALVPRRLLDECLRIERQFGRRRVDRLRNAPVRQSPSGDDPSFSRPIDLDLLFYGGAVISEPGLTIPHPKLHLRRFVLAPMAELEPGFVHPVLHTTVGELLSRLTDDHAVRRLEPAATRQSGY
jgi:2-amino-4-hydroxy-6-hydroxymethyldihydropteridine diphosphokinase